MSEPIPNNSISILSNGERCNEVIPMWSTNSRNKASSQHWKLCALLLGQVCGFYITLKMQEMGPMVYYPYCKGLNVLIIYSAAFSSVILRPLVLVWSGLKPQTSNTAVSKSPTELTRQWLSYPTNKINKAHTTTIRVKPILVLLFLLSKKIYFQNMNLFHMWGRTWLKH